MSPMSAGELAIALKRGEFPNPPLQLLTHAVHLLADEVLDGKQASRKSVREAMDLLRRHRHFEHVHELGVAWHDTFGCDAMIQRLLAQAKVELGALEGADDLLDEAGQMAIRHPTDLEYQAEEKDYNALRGRIRKQRFVLTDNVNVLAESIAYYQKKQLAQPSFFLDVNVLALRVRLHDRIAQPIQVLIELAHDVLKQATVAIRTKPADPWALATASEACLALSRFLPDESWCDWAELWLYRFLAHPKCGPFEIESYFRQVREIWSGAPLDESTCAGRLARIFERHMLRTQRRWSVDARQLQWLQQNPEELEKNFCGEKSFTVADIRKMLALAPNIGCVTNDKGVRMGTGFLVQGSAFGDDGLLFITNAHVISDTLTKAIRGSDARVTFETEADGSMPPCLVQAILFNSEPGQLGNVKEAPGKLDVTVCRLSRTPNGAAGLPVAPTVPWPSPRTKAFVVGHPRAGELQFSLQDSVLLDVCGNERLMHYRTPTDPGSSGSPVFNRDWEVIALHHAGSQTCPRLSGSGFYEANEGITLQAIRQHWKGMATDSLG
ncbi:serine protease [Pseudomonas sp. P1B16]|uniref:serine protease n=1 Tax=Pseudomonas sp. P1B16 TaxID=2986074 RepID=UPI002A24990A|nr:serine protease [Pseudomonas sp. P1B16]WPM28784.1 serine protease [Pseudomonas sp. P1B16]